MKIGVVGCTGKMGGEIIKEVLSTQGCKLVAASAAPDDTNIGKDVGTVIGIGTTGVMISEDPEKLVEKAEMIIDFTNPINSIAYAKLCAGHGKKFVCGTTGFPDQDLQTLSELAKKSPMFWSPNMSIGINLLKKLSFIAAKILGEDSDIEILEMHHNKKVDAPSGTALLLGKEVAKALNSSLQEKAVFNRESTKSARSKGEIGFAVLRGGDVAGDHSVIFAGQGEMLTLSHRATSRVVFAKGAVKAALWLKNKKAGKLYSIDDILV